MRGSRHFGSLLALSAVGALATASSCLVSFDDYPVDPGDASIDGTGVGGGASGAGGSRAFGGSAGVGGTGATAGSGAAGGQPDGAAGAAGSDAAACEIVTELFLPSADTQICPDPSQCEGTIVHGTSAIINIGQCVGLFEFALSPTATAAIQNDPATTIELVLTRVESDTECSGTCPDEAGTLLVRPLKVDGAYWEEGVTGVSASGADWCRRSANPPGDKWGAPGASAQSGVDVWEQSAGAGFAKGFAAQSSVSLSLNVGVHKASATQGLLGVRVEETTGVGRFVASTRETNSPARLFVTRCQVSR